MDVNAVNSMGLTAVHGAANRGSDDIIRFLVDKGAKLDVKDKEGRTPLTWAEGVFLATHPVEAQAELDCVDRDFERAMIRTLARYVTTYVGSAFRRTSTFHSEVELRAELDVSRLQYRGRPSTRSTPSGPA